MKPIVKVFIIMASIASLSGCSASRKVVEKGASDVKSELLASQALAAIVNRQAFIDVDGEILSANLPSSTIVPTRDRSPLKSAVGGGNSLMLNGEQVEFKFAVGVFISDSHDIPMEQACKILSVNDNKKRNGDLIYTLQIVSLGRLSLNYEIIIQLFHSTNQCLVQLRRHDGKELVRFKGKVQSLTEKSGDS